jgi:hypothetical protein
MTVIVSLDSPSCEVPCLILHSVVYRDVTRQAKGLHRLKYVGALERGIVHLSQCNSDWFCHREFDPHVGVTNQTLPSSSGLLEVLPIYQLFVDYVGSKGLALGMAIAVHTPILLSDGTP